MLRQYKQVLWDWNGTLLDDRDLALKVVNRMLLKRGLPPIAIEIYLALFTHPVMDFYEAIGLGTGIITVEEIVHEFKSGYEAGCSACNLQVGAKAALHSFRQAGLRQSILSASHSDTLLRFVTYFGVQGYFASLIGLDNHHAHSKVEQGVAWMNSQQLQPHDVVLIGDTDHDFEVANRLGCDCILVARGHQSEARLKACGVQVISDLTELHKLET